MTEGAFLSWETMEEMYRSFIVWSKLLLHLTLLHTSSLISLLCLCMEMKLRLRDVIGFFTNYLVINKKTAKKKKI
jgi:hypothetical protein